MKLLLRVHCRTDATDGGDSGDAPAGPTEKKMREYQLCEKLSFVLHAIASTAHRAAQRYAHLPSVSTEASSKF